MVENLEFDEQIKPGTSLLQTYSQAQRRKPRKNMKSNGGHKPGNPRRTVCLHFEAPPISALQKVEIGENANGY